MCSVGLSLSQELVEWPLLRREQLPHVCGFTTTLESGTHIM